MTERKKRSKLYIAAMKEQRAGLDEYTKGWTKFMRAHMDEFDKLRKRRSRTIRAR